MLVIRQIRRRLCKRLVIPIQTNLNLPFKVRFIDDRYRKRSINILKRRHFQVFSRAVRVNADGAWARKAKVACKCPETARYFECVALEADEDGIAARRIARVVLGTPPVQVSGCVA
jgi:hypothetical protein